MKGENLAPEQAWNSICKDMDSDRVSLSLPAPIRSLEFLLTPEQAIDLGRHLIEWGARLRDRTLHEELVEMVGRTFETEHNMRINRALYHRALEGR